jgi:hypothetical protein
MTLALRRTAFADGERRPDDYEVRYHDQTVFTAWAAPGGSCGNGLRSAYATRATAQMVAWLIHWTRRRLLSVKRGTATAHFKTHADARPVQTKSFTSGPNGGAADSLDEAKAAFQAARERPLWRRKADEICST